MMRALLVTICILLASTLFLPTFTTARGLSEARFKAVTPCTRNPYKACVPLKPNPPKKKCGPYVRNCPPAEP
ncbi:hypothetical protein CCACVL1_12982 [Corchorus capsularis]|uniref:Rapid ALkalinization Factor n=1 Tax=Corchorus capsularis TaxID=210143 RepID=A0A1R3ICV0_COCAP|nr:hypothetical protein CCACVL1_12982 [Corchorus capsularis]